MTEHLRQHRSGGFPSSSSLRGGAGARAQLGSLFGLEGLAMYLVLGLAVALVLSLAGSGVAIWYLDGKLETAQKEAQKNAEALGKETTSRKGFEAAAAACTAGVEAVERAADERVKKAEREAEISRSKTATAERVAQEILTTPRPQGLDECAAMKKELNDEIDRRRPPR